jgi:hypothetical protein
VVATDTRTSGRGSSAEAEREIERTEEAAVDASTANRFDVRRVIGGLFIIYGVILTVVGIGASHGDLSKADGININLWTGGCMLAFGILMLSWALMHPVGAELATDGDDDETRST